MVRAGASPLIVLSVCLFSSVAADEKKALVTFRNSGEEYLDVFWLQPNSGDLVRAAGIQGGTEARQYTFIGHAFAVVASGGRRFEIKIECSGVYICKAAGGSVECKLNVEELDLYHVLGVEESATYAAIKKSFRNLSLKHHPDKSLSVTSDYFNAIREAYEVLSNPRHRALYDTGGHELLKEARKRSLPETDDINAEINITLADAYHGVEKMFKVRRRVVCRGCRANSEGRHCSGCMPCPSEKRKVSVKMDTYWLHKFEDVPSTEDCRMSETEHRVKIERGVNDGDEIVFRNMAFQKPGHLPGNVTLRVRVKPSDKFERHGDDLSLRINVTLLEALTGWQRGIVHFDRRSVDIFNENVTKPGQVFRVRGDGMPRKESASDFGDLYVTVNVVFPDELTEVDKYMFSVIPALADSSKQCVSRTRSN
eukprot:TRINITY_DN14300_c0_g4_i1.p1 TRINITY_DN14300_c0_g4~~TRINITY_DN14300_c0_g4_i1.p1  ORF type:complete len:454 (+),score=37.67 TRINITY_DN14300_c0_g4_i1:93-1364(+)